jgi:hypothetical protein
MVSGGRCWLGGTTPPDPREGTTHASSPAGGPDPESGACDAMVTASGRISATTWPSGTSFSTSGSVQPADVYLAATDFAGQPVGQADELGHERGRRARVDLSGRCELLQLASVLVTDEEVTRCTSSPAVGAGVSPTEVTAAIALPCAGAMRIRS